MLVNPVDTYETFTLYLGRLNSLIEQNLPFLRTTFNITALQVTCVLSGNRVIPKGIKKALFDKEIGQASVVVAYSKISK